MIGASPDVGERAALALRPMQEADLAAVLEIEASAFPTPWSRRAFETELRTAWSIATVAVEAAATPRPRVIGYACAWHVADEMQLLNVAVHPARRRLGVGKILVRDVVRCAGERGVRSVLLEVRVANVPAQRLYGRLGFRGMGIRRGYYGPGQDGLLMELRLGR